MRKKSNYQKGFEAGLKIGVESCKKDLTMNCPKCGKEYEYCFDLGRVIYCKDCGYCEHASVSNGVCDYCGKK